MALVDYDGSDSDSDQEDSEQKTKVIQNPEIAGEDSFFDAGTEASVEKATLVRNDVLEDIVKPKEWELKLAEKTRKKLEKKAKKAAKREKKEAKKDKKLKIAKIGTGVQKPKKEKAKVMISAFGALSSIADNNASDSDDDDDDTSQAQAKPNPKSSGGFGFLANLPAPKGRNNRTDFGTISSAKSLVPPSVARKTVPLNTGPKVVPAPKFVESDDDDDDGDLPADFFGLSSSTSRNTNIVREIPQMASSSAMDIVGPSRPSNDYIHPSQMYNMVDVDMDEDLPSSSSSKGGRTISDEQAHKLLMRFSHDIGPEEKRSIDEMASSIVDVNVDAAIGPDVKTNILKNLSHRSFAESVSAPLPQVKSNGQLSRRKHQITYLASLAVAKEESLKEQWADQKQTKRMAKAKYGF